MNWKNQSLEPALRAHPALLSAIPHRPLLNRVVSHYENS